MGNKKRDALIILLNVLLPLLAGAVLFGIWNPGTYIGSLVCRLLRLLDIRCLGDITNGWPGIWIKYYGADMVWAYAFASSIYFVTRNNRKTRIPCFAACILVEVLFELAQYAHFISGYFDVMDVVVEVTMNFCAYLAMRQQLREDAVKLAP